MISSKSYKNKYAANQYKSKKYFLKIPSDPRIWKTGIV